METRIGKYFCAVQCETERVPLFEESTAVPPPAETERAESITQIHLVLTESQIDIMTG